MSASKTKQRPKEVEDNKEEGEERGGTGRRGTKGRIDSRASGDTDSTGWETVGRERMEGWRRNGEMDGGRRCCRWWEMEGFSKRGERSIKERRGREVEMGWWWRERYG